MTAVHSPLLVQVQSFLEEYVSKIPIQSTVGIAFDVINKMSMQESKTILLPPIKDQVERPTYQYESPVALYSQAGFNWNERAVALSLFRSIVTYLALQALSTVSLCVNGSVGCSKVVLGFIFVSIDRDKAQEFLEEGIYQALTAIYDYVIGQFGLICAAFSLLEGGSPELAFELHSKIFQIYTPNPIKPEVAEDLSALRRIAVAFQEMILSSDPENYVNSVTKAINGDSPVDKRLRRKIQRV